MTFSFTLPTAVDKALTDAQVLLYSVAAFTISALLEIILFHGNRPDCCLHAQTHPKTQMACDWFYSDAAVFE